MLHAKTKTRCRVIRDISLAPHTVLRRGEKGTVVWLEKDALGLYSLDVTMDRYHHGLAEWKNVAHLVGEDVAYLARLTELQVGFLLMIGAVLLITGVVVLLD